MATKVNGKLGNLNPCCPQNPWTYGHKILLRVMMSGHLPLCKISLRFGNGFCSPSHPAPACASVYKVTSLVFFGGGVLVTPYREAPCIDFKTYMWNDVVSLKDVPFGGLENKISHFDPIFRKNANFRPISYGTKLCIKKALTMAMFICKLPLIVSVAPWKLYSK